MDNFDNTEDTVDLNELVQTPEPLVTPPINALRNKAATTAIIAGSGAQAPELYQSIVAEGQQGQSNTYTNVNNKTQETARAADMKGVMSILSDPTIPMDQKRAILDNVKRSQFLNDEKTLLQTQSLSTESRGENIEQEAVRLTAADAIAEIGKARNDIQGLVNAHAASLDPVSVSTFGGMLEAWVLPFGNSIATYNIIKGLADKEGRKLSVWDKVKIFLTPGTQTMNLVDRMEGLPPEAQVEFTRSLIDVISKNSGIIFSNQNQFVQFDKAVNIWSEGGYSNTMAFLDNITPLLDVIGLGQLIRDGIRAKAALKTAPPALGIPAVPGELVGPSTPPPQVWRSNRDPAKWTFDPETPTVSQPQGPVSGILSEPTPGVSVLQGGSGTKAAEPQRQVPSLFKPTEITTSQEAASTVARPGVSALEGGTGAKALPPAPRTAAMFRAPEQVTKDVIKRVETNGIAAIDNPSAPAKIIQQSNPSQARGIHAAVAQGDGTVAEALYNTNKVDALASDIVPQFTTAQGAVRTRVPDIERNLRERMGVTNELTDVINTSGALESTRAEKEVALASVKNDFQNASGLTVNDAMSSFTVDGGRIKISAVYGTTEGGFLTPEAAIEQARSALRAHGIRGDEMTILKKEGLDHVPVEYSQVANTEGDYLVRIDTYHDIDPTDLGALEHLDVKRNLFDRISPWIPGITDPARWVMDAASMLHPTYVSAASNAIDLTSRFDKFLLDLASEYSDKWKQLGKDRKELVNDYLREANFNQIAFDVADLTARGFLPKEIDAIRSWRKFWDAHFYLENYDIVRTLNSEGYELFENATTKLVAKEIAKNATLGGELNAKGTRVVGGVNIFNPASNDVTVLTKTEIDDLYTNGGYLAKLRRPTVFNGVATEHMMVRNTPTEYLRKVRDTDEILNYRDGYFQLQYKAPRFVDEIVRDAAGNVAYHKAIAVAGDTKEAQIFADRMRAQGKEIGPVRGDDRALQRGSDDWWDVNAASGRIAQRHRGTLLEDSSGLNHLGDGSYILNPVESAIRAARSIAGRTISRPMLETAKARFMAQYERFLPSNNMGGVKFPDKIGEIGSKGEFTSSEIADARTTWQYLNYLENGYLNGVDNFWKASLNAMAQYAGEKGLTKLERGAAGLAEGSGGPVSLAKNTVFFAYLGSNPLRQLIVQTHQVVRTWAYNPIGWLTGSTTGLTTAYLGKKLGLNVPVKDAADFIKFMDESGLLDSVDKQNLVRGSLKDAAESSNPVFRAVGKGAEIPRKIGFDTGEVGNLLGHGASVYDKYRRAGENMSDKITRAEMVAEIRALSYEMNFAGDMPYNQTTPSMVLQFMQVPHKAFLQMTNRKLDRATRARMVVGDMILWGPPTLIASSLLGGDILPDNKEIRELVTWGVESTMLNYMFTELFGQETEIDWSSLAPYDTTGWAEFFRSMYSEGFDQVLLNSPTGQLFLKDGGRFDNAVTSMARYFSGFYEESQTPESFVGMLHEIAKISSGYNNASQAFSEQTRAALAVDAIRRMDKYGGTIDKSISSPEIIAKMFGFGTENTRDLYAIANSTGKGTKSHKEEVLRVYNQAKQYYTEKLGVETSDPRMITALTGFILNTYRDDPEALQIIKQQRLMDMTGKDQGLLRQMMKRSGIPDGGEYKDEIRRAPIPEEQKTLLLQRIDDIEKARSNLKNMKKEND